MLASVLASLALAAPGCGGGETVYLDGPLRISAVAYRDADEAGWFEFGCRRGGRRVEVGGTGSTTGVASNDTPAYAVDARRRFLAAYETSDSEGGPDADFNVYDLRTRKHLTFLNAVCCPRRPSFGVASDGTLVADGVVKRPGRRAVRIGGRDFALAGGTVYWTAGGEARSMALPGARGGESRMLEPVRVHRRRGPCIERPGTTVAASPSIRVARRDGRVFACRDRLRRRIALDGVPRIAGDRWLLDGPRLIDSKTGRIATRGIGRPATLLSDGTAAWLDGARLQVAAPGAAPAELSAGASALASGRKTIYWTEAGAPRRHAPAP